MLFQYFLCERVGFVSLAYECGLGEWNGYKGGLKVMWGARALCKVRSAGRFV